MNNPEKTKIAQKLIDNTITDEEINDLSMQIEKDDYYVNTFFMQNLTPVLIKDVSKTVLALNTINQRIPNLIPIFINFCFTHELDYYYYGNEENKFNFGNQLIELIRLFVENNFTTIQHIIDLLDYDKNKKLNFSFANNIVNLFPQIKEIAPQIDEKVRYYNAIANKLISDSEICRDVAWPSVIIGDVSNPRISKFGGVQPFLPEEGNTLCHGCHANCSMICQIYIPTTPKWFQDRFPPEYRDSLIVVFYCNTCYLNVEAKFYTSDKLDSLVYTNDIVYTGNYTFNDPRIVTGWTSGKMMPIMGNAIMNTLSEQYFNKSDQFKEYFTRFNFQNGPRGKNQTYIGGWPDFVQGDCTPDNSFFIINLSQSCSSTAMWGDAGTAQVWAKKPEGDYFGDLVAEWACC